MRLYKAFQFLTSWSSITCELNDIILHLKLQERSKPKFSQLVIATGSSVWILDWIMMKFDPKPSPHQFKTFHFCCLSSVTTSGLTEGSGHGVQSVNRFSYFLVSPWCKNTFAKDCPDCTWQQWWKLNNYVSPSEVVAQRGGGSLGRGFPIKTLVLIKSLLGAMLQRVCGESEQHEGQLGDPTEQPAAAQPALSPARLRWAQPADASSRHLLKA